MDLEQNEEERGLLSSQDLKDIPVLLPLQRCRGLGWLKGKHWGCLGLIDSGLYAALFSRVVLVQDSDNGAAANTAAPPPAAATPPSAAPAAAAPTAPFAAAAEAGSNTGDAVLRVLDSVSPVEMEAAPGEAEEEGGVAAGEMFAALLLPASHPIKRDSKVIEGNFTVLHKVQQDSAEGEDATELQVCCGEMLWHPQPPLLIACRSLWTAQQRMRLTKGSNNPSATAAAAAAASVAAAPTAATTTATAAAAAAAAAPGAPNEYLVLSDIEENDDEGPSAAEKNLEAFRATDVPRAALKALRGSLSDREAFRRIAAETAAVSVQSIRQMPATLARLSAATAEVFQRAAADWAAAGSAAIQAAAASAAKVQKAWREMHDKSSSSSTNSKPDAGNDADSHA